MMRPGVLLDMVKVKSGGVVEKMEVRGWRRRRRRRTEAMKRPKRPPMPKPMTPDMMDLP
jgi:hypothetical protein